MLEMLLLASCLTTEPVCKPAAKAYYASKPYISRTLKKTRSKVVAYTGTWVLYAAPAVALTRDGATAQFRIARNFTLQFDGSRSTLSWDMEF